MPVFPSPLPHTEIERLRRLYILALSAIAVLAVLGQFAVQYALNNDEMNSRIVNIAGRQRMLSQRLCRIALQRTFMETSPEATPLKDFQTTRVLWRQSHYGLQHGDSALHLPSGKNSPRILLMFARIEPVFRTMDSLCDRLIQTDSKAMDQRHHELELMLFLGCSDDYLSQMNAIVFAYDEGFRWDMQRLQAIELMLFVLIILALVFEAVSVFRPAVQHLGRFVLALEEVNQKLRHSNDELLRRQAVSEIHTVELEEMNTNIRAQNLELERHRSTLQEKMFELDRAYSDVQKAQKVQLEFLANLSHELRTPMTAVIGFTEILLSDYIPEEGKDLGRQVLRSANILLVLLNDLIDFAHIEAGLFYLRRELQPIAPVVEDICYLMQSEAEAKHLAFRSAIAPEVPTMLEFDARRIRQILFNLLSNAVKFTETGFVELRVLFDKATKTLRFEVQDSGIGIGREDQERIFEPFVQQDGSPTRRYGGLGVGLALVKRIVTLKGGRIWVDSELGKGTTVILELQK